MVQFLFVLLLILAFPRIAVALLGAAIVLTQLAVFGLLLGLAALILVILF